MSKILKDLIVSSLYLYLFQALNYVLPFLILPYLLSTLSLTAFGVFAFSQSLVQFLILVVDFGFNLSVSKRIAALPKDAPEIAKIYWQVIFTKLCFCLLISLLIFISFSALTSLSVYKNAVYFSLITLLGTALFPVWLYQGLNEMKSLSLITAIAKLLTLPLVFVFVNSSDDYLPAVLLHSASFVLAGIISFLWILSRKSYRIHFNRNLFKVKDIIPQIRESWHFFLSNVSISLYTNSLTLLLGFFGTPTQVGVFSAIERIVRIVCFAVYVPINQAAFPVIARLKHTDFTQAVRIFRLLVYTLTGLMFSVTLFFLFFGSDLVSRFLKQTVDKEILQIAIFSVLPIALGAACGQLGLVALGDEMQKRIFNKIYLYVGLISLPLCLISIGLFHVNGAVFSMMFTECAIFIAMFTAVKKYHYL